MGLLHTDALHRFRAFWWRNSMIVRWTAVAGLAAAAVVSCRIPAVTDPTTVIAARDVPAGTTLSSEDVTIGPPDTSAAADSGQVVGEVARGPITAGEPISASRLVPGRTVAVPTGQVVYPLAVSRGHLVDLLEPGDRVDVLLAAGHGSGAQRLASGLEVLAVPGAENDGLGPSDRAATVLVAADERTALRLADVRPGDEVSLALRSSRPAAAGSNSGHSTDHNLTVPPP